MTVFRIIAGLSVAALLIGMAFDLRRRSKSWKAAGDLLRRQMRSSRRGRRDGTGNRLDNLRRRVTIVSGGFFLILALTGVLPVVFLGGHLSGVLLVVHVSVAPLFAVSLSALALLWAHRLRFDEWDWRMVLGFGRGDSHGNDALVRFALKVGFWLVLLLSLPLMLTVILGLFPLFGTDGEALLIRLHGYSALFLLIISLGEMYLMIAYTDEQPLKEKDT